MGATFRRTAKMLVTFALHAAALHAAALAPSRMRVDGSDFSGAGPQGAVYALPASKAAHTFTWAPGAAQAAYRIVATHAVTNATAWDSGAVASAAPRAAAALGALAPGTYTWTVATAGGGGGWSAPSAPASFHLAPDDAPSWDGVPWIKGESLLPPPPPVRCWWC